MKRKNFKPSNYLLHKKVPKRQTKKIDDLLNKHQTILWPLFLIFITFIFFSIPGLYFLKTTIINNRRVNYEIANYLHKEKSAKLNDYFLKKQKKMKSTEGRLIIFFFLFLLIIFLILFIIVLILVTKK